MDRYRVMGNPVQHSRSPWIHARFAQLLGERIEYGRQLVPADGFAAALHGFIADGGRGCNVTVPFKLEAPGLAQTVHERVALAQAANTLRIEADGAISAFNTDGIGLVSDIMRNAGFDIAGRDVLLLGAGGAAAGVLGPLLEARPRRVVVANRTQQRAKVLVERHGALALLQKCELQSESQSAVAADFHLILNATAASMTGAAVPVSPRVLKPGALAVDLMYGPAAQGFLRWAGDHGASARDGLGMLVEQAAEAFLIWRGQRPPSSQVLAELRDVVRETP